MCKQPACDIEIENKSDNIRNSQNDRAGCYFWVEMNFANQGGNNDAEQTSACHRKKNTEENHNSRGQLFFPQHRYKADRNSAAKPENQSNDDFEPQSFEKVFPVDFFWRQSLERDSH